MLNHFWGRRSLGGPGGPGGFVLCAFLALSAATGADDEAGRASKASKSHEWDVLIFTQHWPATVCMTWKEKGSAHSCTLPAQKNAWTVHGVWPTKLNTMGPSFCDPSMKFKINGIQSIEPQMEQFWTNIEKDTPLYSLWEHEWSKHGTCAVQLQALDSEMKYFAQGLRWLQLYSMSGILEKTNILPNDTATYSSENVYQSVQKVIGKNPSIHCVIDAHTGHSYLFEIRICFNKALELIDCDGVKADSTLSKNPNNHCDDTKPLVYPSIVPTFKRKASLPLIEIYKTISWLRWYTF